MGVGAATTETEEFDTSKSLTMEKMMEAIKRRRKKKPPKEEELTEDEFEDFMEMHDA